MLANQFCRVVCTSSVLFSHVLSKSRRLHSSLRPDFVIRLRQSLTCSLILFVYKKTMCNLQPEALSRSSTPLSPMASGPPLGMPQRRSSVGNNQDLLPFFELDICTASKQEHIIAAVSCFYLTVSNNFNSYNLAFPDPILGLKVLQNV